MRVMIDTNVIISAMLKEGSLPDIILNEHNIDVLITGDQHFLVLEIDFPKICNPAEYKKLYIDNSMQHNSNH